MTIKVEIDRAQAIADLHQLGLDLQVKAVQAGLRRPGSLLARTMKQLAPRVTGNLQESITSRVLSRSAGERLDILAIPVDPKATVAVLVGPNKKIDKRSYAYIGTLVETGTKPHTIRPRNPGGFLRFGRWGGGVARGTVEHPGARPEPFMENALEAASPMIETLFFQGLAAFLDRNSKVTA